MGPGRRPLRGGPLAAWLLLLLLAAPAPTGAWYKHRTSPRYRTVGRAAGLLLGLRRSSHLWRRALFPPAAPHAWGPLSLAASSLGAPPQGPSAPEALLCLPSAGQGLRSGAQGSAGMGRPRSPRARGSETGQGRGFWTPAAPARAFRRTLPAQSRSPLRR